MLIVKLENSLKISDLTSDDRNGTLAFRSHGMGWCDQEWVILLSECQPLTIFWFHFFFSILSVAMLCNFFASFECESRNSFKLKKLKWIQWVAFSFIYFQKHERSRKVQPLWNTALEVPEFTAASYSSTPWWIKQPLMLLGVHSSRTNNSVILPLTAMCIAGVAFPSPESPWKFLLHGCSWNLQ